MYWLIRFLSIMQFVLLMFVPVEPLSLSLFFCTTFLVKFCCGFTYNTNLTNIKNYAEFLELSRERRRKIIKSARRVKNAGFMLAACALLTNLVPLFVGLIHYETLMGVYLQWLIFTGFAIIELFIGAAIVSIASSTLNHTQVLNSNTAPNHNTPETEPTARVLHETETHTCMKEGDRVVLIPKQGAILK